MTTKIFRIDLNPYHHTLYNNLNDIVLESALEGSKIPTIDDMVFHIRLSIIKIN